MRLAGMRETLCLAASEPAPKCLVLFQAHTLSGLPASLLSLEKASARQIAKCHGGDVQPEHVEQCSGPLESPGLQPSRIQSCNSGKCRDTSGNAYPDKGNGRYIRWGGELCRMQGATILHWSHIRRGLQRKGRALRVNPSGIRSDPPQGVEAANIPKAPMMNDDAGGWFAWVEASIGGRLTKPSVGEVCWRDEPLARARRQAALRKWLKSGSSDLPGEESRWRSH